MAVYNVSPDRIERADEHPLAPHLRRLGYQEKDIIEFTRGYRSPSGSRGATKQYGTGAAYRDPYGNARAAAQALAGTPQTAGADDFMAYMAGTYNSIEGFIGLGDDPNVVSRGEARSGFAEPGQLQQFGPQGVGGQSGRMNTVYGRPIYRNGSEFAFGMNLGADKVREWQSFFSGLGFKTGPAGHWTNHEISAMRAFMAMANGTPGGGMNVDTLRDLVMDQARAGVYFFRGVNEEGDLLPSMLGETPVGDLTGSGGGGGGTGPGFDQPFTETITRNIVQEFSMDKGMLALRNIVAQEIGRAPSDDEVKAYVRELNAAFRADPTIITQVTVTDPITGESTTDITESETGVEPEARALQFAEDVSPEERREHQTGRYFDGLMSAIGM